MVMKSVPSDFWKKKKKKKRSVLFIFIVIQAAFLYVVKQINWKGGLTVGSVDVLLEGSTEL